MRQTASHWRELAALAPHVRRLELIKQLPVNLTDGFLNGDAAPARRQYDGILEIGRLPLLLRVDANHAELLPDFLKEHVQAQLHVHGDAAAEGVLGDGVDLLDGYGVYLVVDVDAFDVFSVSLNNINQLVHIIVPSENHVSIVHLILSQHILHHPLVNLGQCALGIELNAAHFLRRDRDVGLLLVQPDAHLLELHVQFGFLRFSFLAIEDHEYQIRRLSNRNDLPTTTLAIGGPLNNTRQIEQLHFGIVDHQVAGDAGERRELVGRSLTLRITELVEQGGLAHRRKPNHNYPGMPTLLNIEALALGSLLRLCLLLHRLELGEASLHLTPMVLSRLILLRPSHLLLDFSNLVT